MLSTISIYSMRPVYWTVTNYSFSTTQHYYSVRIAERKYNVH